MRYIIVISFHMKPQNGRKRSAQRRNVRIKNESLDVVNASFLRKQWNVLELLILHNKVLT